MTSFRPNMEDTKIITLIHFISKQNLLVLGLLLCRGFLRCDDLGINTIFRHRIIKVWEEAEIERGQL